jgi:hypothetical protein
MRGARGDHGTRHQHRHRPHQPRAHRGRRQTRGPRAAPSVARPRGQTVPPERARCFVRRSFQLRYAGRSRCSGRAGQERACHSRAARRRGFDWRLRHRPRDDGGIRPFRRGSAGDLVSQRRSPRRASHVGDRGRRELADLALGRRHRAMPPFRSPLVLRDGWLGPNGTRRGIPDVTTDHALRSNRAAGRPRR